jgi:uncharacterized protein
MQLLLCKIKAEMMKNLLQHSAIMLIFTLLLLSTAGCAKEEQNSQYFTRDSWITDYANVLSQADKTRLSASLEAYEKETCHQVLVLIIPSLVGESISSFSQRIATAWNIGQEGFGNGILLTIAMEEGSIRLETASAFDWFVEQGTTDRILKDVMVPFFKDKRYTAGIEQGLAEIMGAARLKVIPENHRPAVCRK